MLKGFREFIMRGNVVDLAIAVVIGAAFGAIVTALVADIVAAIGGQPSFEDLNFKIHGSTFLYGDFINKVITFVIIAAVIYFLIVLPLNKIAERRAARMATGEPDPTPKAEDILLLEQIRDLLAAGTGGGAQSLPTAATGPDVSTTKPSPGTTA